MASLRTLPGIKADRLESAAACVVRNIVTGMTAEVEASWMTEVERRCREIDEGEAELVLRRMRERFA